MEYLIFLKLGLTAAILAAIIIWRKRGNNHINKPVELEDGNFAIPKPEDELMEGVEFDEIQIDIKLKDVEIAQRPPDPKGIPTIRPK